jgi:hypothetical protein
VGWPVAGGKRRRAGVIWIFTNFSPSIFLKINIIVTAVFIGKYAYLKDIQQQRQD